MFHSSVAQYINENWDRSVYRDTPETAFRGIVLPYPYTSPCIKGEGHFTFFFYWDTCFANVGLLHSGRRDLARDNIRNILWFIRRMGYMPNHTGITNRSQPPLLCRMVSDYFAEEEVRVAEADFFRECAEGLKCEYFFWVNARHTPTGLQAFGTHDTTDGACRFYDSVLVRRHKQDPLAPIPEKVSAGFHGLAEAETGWDFTPRFDRRCRDFNAVDLNGLLYDYEVYLALASEWLDWGDRDLWSGRAAARRERIALLWHTGRGLLMDYDFVGGQCSPVASLASFVPLWTGLATEEQAAATRSNLPLFERAHGLAVTEDSPLAAGYQWAFPNVWPPLVYMAVQGLRRYGFEEDALRISRQFIATTDRLFHETGQLWEKTDAVTGGVAQSEYAAAPMMGWTAGVYLALADFIQQ